MTPPTEREQKWLERLCSQPAMLMWDGKRNVPNPIIVAALAEVLTKTKEACAKECETQMGECNARPNCHLRDATLIRNLEITGE